jgi:hypothetical protein
MDREKKFRTFLKILEREGYPNPNVKSLASLVNYDLKDLMVDLVEFTGLDNTEKFISKGINSLVGPERKIRLELSDFYGEGAFIVLHVRDFYVDMDDTADGVRLDASFGDSSIPDAEGNLKTLEQIYNDLDFSEWSNYDELHDSLWGEFQDWFEDRLGYKIYSN